MDNNLRFTLGCIPRVRAVRPPSIAEIIAICSVRTGSLWKRSHSGVVYRPVWGLHPLQLHTINNNYLGGNVHYLCHPLNRSTKISWCFIHTNLNISNLIVTLIFYNTAIKIVRLTIFANINP